MMLSSWAASNLVKTKTDWHIWFGIGHQVIPHGSKFCAQRSRRCWTRCLPGPQGLIDIYRLAKLVGPTSLVKHPICAARFGHWHVHQISPIGLPIKTEGLGLWICGWSKTISMRRLAAHGPLSMLDQVAWRWRQSKGSWDMDEMITGSLDPPLPRKKWSF